MQILNEISRTFGEYLLLPNLVTKDCTPEQMDVSAPVVRHRVEEVPSLRIVTPAGLAIMEAVSSPRMASALAQIGGLSFLPQSQPMTP